MGVVNYGASLFAFESKLSDNAPASGDRHPFVACRPYLGVVEGFEFVGVFVGRLVVGFSVRVVPWVGGCRGVRLALGWSGWTGGGGVSGVCPVAFGAL